MKFPKDMTFIAILVATIVPGFLVIQLVYWHL
jgi:hypothetical protein